MNDFYNMVSLAVFHRLHTFLKFQTGINFTIGSCYLNIIFLSPVVNFELELIL
jgi:hypothetical protein